jgi:hypothetical protein
LCRKQKGYIVIESENIQFEGVKQSETIERYIRDELEKLRDVDTKITSSTIIVTPPHAKRFAGDPCCLRVWLTIEGCPDVVVNHDPGEGRRHDAQAIAVRDAFRIVRRRLESTLRRRERQPS